MLKFKCVFKVFSISHKYHFESLEAWSRRLLERHCTSCADEDGKHHILDSPSICEADLELMLRLAIRHNLDSLLEAAENALMRRLKEDLTFHSISHNLELAEELGMRKFQGRLYYHELLRQEAVSKMMDGSTAYSTQSKLTEKQYLSLFRGYWSLTRYWRELPPFVRSKSLPALTSCTRSHGVCEAEWSNLWKEDYLKSKDDPSPYKFGPLEKLNNIRSSSILRLTSSLIRILPSGSSKNQQGQAMQPCGSSELDEIIKHLQDTLEDHFLSPPSLIFTNGR